MSMLAAGILMLVLPVFAGRVAVDATFRCLDVLKQKYGTH